MARAQQQIVLSAEAPSDSGKLGFYVDGRLAGWSAAPFRLPWTLSRGKHSVLVRSSQGLSSQPVHFEVR